MKQKKTKKIARKEEETRLPQYAGPMELKEADVAYKAPLKMNIRMAKDRFSHVVELAAQGNEIIITSDGEPKAKIVPYVRERKRFVPNWDLIKGWETAKGPTGTEIIRAERDERD